MKSFVHTLDYLSLWMVAIIWLSQNVLPWQNMYDDVTEL